MSQLLDILRQENVHTYAINMFQSKANQSPPYPYLKDPETRAREFLSRLAKETNGQTFLGGSPEERLKYASQLLESQRPQYTLEYVSTKTQDKDLNRKIKVKLIDALSKNKYSVTTFIE